MKLKIVVAIAVVALTAASLFVFTYKPAAPDVAFSPLQGQSFRTADLRGKADVVDYLDREARPLPPLVEDRRSSVAAP